MTAFLLSFCLLNLENRMTVCMGYPAMTPKWESRKTPPEGGRKAMQENGRMLISQLRRKTMCSK